VNDTLTLHFKMMDEKVQEHADIRDAYKDVALKVTPDLGVSKLTDFHMDITDGKRTEKLDKRIIDRLM